MAPQLTNVFGGFFVSVSFIDGRPAEQIFVRLLPPRFYPDLRRALEDEPRQAEIFTGRDSAYIDLLRPPSIEHILLAGWGLNREHFNRSLSRVLENTAEEAGIVLEMIEAFPTSIKELMPDVVAHYREIAATCAKNGLPPNRLISASETQPVQKN